MRKSIIWIIAIILLTTSVFAAGMGEIGPGPRPDPRDPEPVHVKSMVVEDIYQLKEDPRYDCNIDRGEIITKERLSNDIGLIAAEQPALSITNNRHRPSLGERVYCGDGSDIFIRDNKTLINITFEDISTIIDVFVTDGSEIEDILPDVKIFYDDDKEKWNLTNIDHEWEKGELLTWYLSSTHPIHKDYYHIYASLGGNKQFIYDMRVVEDTCWGYENESRKRFEGSCLMMKNRRYGATQNEMYIDFMATKGWDGFTPDVEIDPAVYNATENTIYLQANTTNFTCAIIAADINNASIISWNGTTSTCLLNATIYINVSAHLVIDNETWIIDNTVQFEDGLENAGNLTISNSNFTQLDITKDGYVLSSLDGSDLNIDDTTFDYYGQSDTFGQCISIDGEVHGHITNSHLTSRYGGCSFVMWNSGNSVAFVINNNTFVATANPYARSDLLIAGFNSELYNITNNYFTSTGGFIVISVYLSNSTRFNINYNRLYHVGRFYTMGFLMDTFSRNSDINYNNFTNLNSTTAGIGFITTKAEDMRLHNNRFVMTGASPLAVFIRYLFSIVTFGETDLNSKNISVYDGYFYTNATSGNSLGILWKNQSYVERCDDNVFRTYGPNETSISFWLVNTSALDCDRNNVISDGHAIALEDSVFSGNDSVVAGGISSATSRGTTGIKGISRTTNGSSLPNVQIEPGANPILVQKYFATTVTNESSIPESGVSVTMTDVDSLTIYNEVTDGVGQTPALPINVTFFTDTVQINYTPHNYIAQKGISSTGDSITMNKSKYLDLVLIELSVSIIRPLNISYNYEQNFSFLYNAKAGFGLSCWYSFDGGPNITLPGCDNFSLDFPPGHHDIIIYGEDGLSNQVSDNVSFYMRFSGGAYATIVVGHEYERGDTVLLGVTIRDFYDMPYTAGNITANVYYPNETIWKGNISLTLFKDGFYRTTFPVEATNPYGDYPFSIHGPVIAWESFQVKTSIGDLNSYLQDINSTVTDTNIMTRFLRGLQKIFAP